MKNYKKTNIVDEYPQILKYWDYVNNAGLLPADYSRGSHAKVQWICSSCGASYQKIIKDQIRRNNTLCPTCSRKAARKKENRSELGQRAAAARTVNKIKNGESFADRHPELLKYWDYKNNTIQPNELTCGSHTEVNWICDIGHSYQRSPRIQLRSKKCPVCANKQLLVGYNDLQKVRPDIAEEWNYEKNGDLKPCDVVFGGAQKVWWKCKQNHEWCAKIYERTAQSHGCPYCRSLKIKRGDNDFATLHPDIAKQWDYELNGDNIPEDYSSHSKYRAHWVCGKGHRWQVSISSRVSENSKCPWCMQERRTSFPEQAIFYYLDIYFDGVKNRSDILGIEADVLVESCKTVVEYDGIYWHKKKLTKDEAKNRLFIENGYRVIRVRERGLPDMEGVKCITVNNYASPDSMGQCVIELLKNMGINNPNVDLRRDNEAIYRRFVTAIKENSIANVHPELLKDWDYEKNVGLDPECISAGSRIRVCWRCHVCGHKWSTLAKSRTRTKTMCPMCLRLKRQNIGKRIINLNTGIIYDTLGEAAASCNGLKGNICSCCNGSKKSAYGYRWAYFE